MLLKLLPIITRGKKVTFNIKIIETKEYYEIRVYITYFAKKKSRKFVFITFLIYEKFFTK